MRALPGTLRALAPWHAGAGEQPWYTQGNFEPARRLEFRLINTLDFDREHAPVVIASGTVSRS